MNKSNRIHGAINLIHAIMKNFKGFYSIDILHRSDVHIDIDIQGTPLTVDRNLFERIEVIVEELYDDITIAYRIEVDKGIQGMHADYIIWDDVSSEANETGGLVDDVVVWKEGLINE